MFKKIVVILSFLVSFSYAEFREVTPKDLEDMIKHKITVIDIRTPAEWEQTGVIATAHKMMFFREDGYYNINLWMENFTQVVKDKSQPFVLVCRSGNRTGSVGEFLSHKLKYENVYHLQEGINSWIEEGRKTVK